jgi:hypothetical protein
MLSFPGFPAERTAVRKIGSMLTVVVMGASALAMVPASSAEAASCKQRLSVSISPDPVTSNPYAGSSQATGTVWLRCRLGAHGARAQITTWWGGFTAPPSLWVARYSSTAHFPLNVFSNDRTQTHVVGTTGRTTRHDPGDGTAGSCAVRFHDHSPTPSGSLSPRRRVVSVFRCRSLPHPRPRRSI